MVESIRRKIAELVYPEIFLEASLWREDHKDLFREWSRYNKALSLIKDWYSSLSTSTKKKMNRTVFKNVADILSSK